MALVKESWLDSVTADVASSVEEVTGMTAYCLHAVTTGGPLSAGVVDLQGSVDGVNWASLAAVNYATPFPASRIVWVTGRPVKYIRVVLDGLSGGTSPTVTASVVAV